MAFLMLKVPFLRGLFDILNKCVSVIEESTRAGYIFRLRLYRGRTAPFQPEQAGASFVLAIQALPVVLVVSALSSLLFYWRILPVVVHAFAWVFRRTMRVGGAVGLSAAANVFLGMVEAPLFVRPYLAQMTRTELFITMNGGMAGIAGTVMVLYASY